MDPKFTDETLQNLIASKPSKPSDYYGSTICETCEFET